MQNLKRLLHGAFLLIITIILSKCMRKTQRIDLYYSIKHNKPDDHFYISSIITTFTSGKNT